MHLFKQLIANRALVITCAGLLALAGCGGEGPKGPRGPEGNGIAGTNGDDGVDGADGTDGTNGVNGGNGTNGTDGTDLVNVVPAEYTAANGIAGGAAYSKWSHSSAGGSGSAGVANLEFVRCKTCHAWDGQGNAASYADRTGVSSGVASRPNVSSVNLRTAAASSSYQELFDTIVSPYGRPLTAQNSAHPDFTATLTNNQVWNLVKFMREEWVNPNDLYTLVVSGQPMHYEYAAATTSWVLVKPTLTYSNIGKDGDAVAGNTSYTAKCAGCHGANGSTVLLETNTMSLGEFVRAKPHEAWFKIKFGTQGAMPAIATSTQEIKNLYKAFTNLTDFPNYP